MYRDILKNFYIYYIKNNEPIYPGGEGAIQNYLDNTPLIDTSSYYSLTFNENTSLKFDTSFVLYEFHLSVDEMLISRAKEYGINLLSPITNVPKYYGNGLIAINKKTFRVLFLSGYLFLNDMSSVYYEKLKNDYRNNIIDYIKLRYFNYAPYEININEDGWVYFKSRNYIVGKETEFKIKITTKDQNHIIINELVFIN